MQAFRPLQRYFEFSGRSGRPEFWQWIAVSTVGQWVVMALEKAISDYGDFPTMLTLYACGAFIPTVAVAFRRLHDSGKSGWPYVVAMILIGVAVGLYVANETARQRTGEDELLVLVLVAALITVGWVIYTIVLLAQRGDDGPNAYGPPDSWQRAPGPAAIPRHSAAHPPAASTGYDDALASIERLGKLKEQGLLTDEEFAAQKARLLGAIR